MSRPVIRKWTASRRPEPSWNTTYFPRRPTDAIDSPARACSKTSPSGAIAILRIVTVAAAMVLPDTALARPRAMVSTSGSSGTSSQNPVCEEDVAADSREPDRKRSTTATPSGSQDPFLSARPFGGLERLRQADERQPARRNRDRRGRRFWRSHVSHDVHDQDRRSRLRAARISEEGHVGRQYRCHRRATATHWRIPLRPSL